MDVLCLGSVHIPASSQGAYLCQYQPTDPRNYGVGSPGDLCQYQPTDRRNYGVGSPGEI